MVEWTSRLLSMWLALFQSESMAIAGRTRGGDEVAAGLARELAPDEVCRSMPQHCSST